VSTDREIILKPSHQPTGRTQHFRDGTTLPSPHRLRITSFEGDPGFYLLYLDEAGRELTDTYHDTLEQAFEQAQWEFGVLPTEWSIIDRG
jgi:hypothetical protein